MSAALTASVYVVWVLLILLSYAVFVLYRHFGQIYVSSPRGRAEQGPDIGSALLSIGRTDMSGRDVVLPTRQPAVVLFVSIGCSLCSEIRDQLDGLESFSDRVTAVAFCAGALQDVRAWADRSPGFVQVVRDVKGAAANQYKVNTLPFAIAVGAEGAVRAKSIINGRDGVIWAAEEALSLPVVGEEESAADGIQTTEVART
jgi:hypothetical protein